MNFIVVFSLSLAVFAFQSLLSPTLSTVFAGASLHLILAPAWLAFALGFLLWSFLPETWRVRFSQQKLIQWFSVFLTTLSLPVSFFLIKNNQEQLNLLLLGKAKLQGDSSIESLLATSYNAFLLPMTFCAALPFLFYGLYLSLVLQNLPRARLKYFLVTELSGIMLGMIGAAALLDITGSWGSSARFSLLGAVVGLLVSSRQLPRIKSQLCLGLITLVLGVTSWLYLPSFEPEMSLNLSAHDFAFAKQVTEEKRSWTSFAKIQTLKIQGKDKSRQVIALGNGTGTTRLDKIDENLQSTPALTTVQISLALNPQKILILFAGAGAEIPAFEKYSSVSAKRPLQITGVELNPAVIDQALANKDYGLGPYLQKRQQVSLVNMDARLFLQRTSENYDLILFSWAGATVAHYSGAVIHTTQFVLTRESLQQAYRHLNEGGALVIMPGSKMNILTSLKELEKRGEIQSLAKNVAIIAFNDKPQWQKNWDDNVLILKKGPLNATTLEKLRTVAEALNGKLVLSPEENTPDFQWHQKMLAASDTRAVQEALQRQYQIYFDDFTDDRPFVYHTTQSLFAGGISFWWQRLLALRLNSILHDRVDFILGMILLAGIVLLGFLVCLRPWPQASRGSQASLYFSSFFLGIASVGLQLVVTYRSLLFLGNPTYALIFSTLLWVGGSALAALNFDKLEKRRMLLGLTMGLGCLVLIVFLGATQLESFKQSLFVMPLALRLFVLGLFLLPASIALGLLFPSVLGRAFIIRTELIHRLTAVDGIATALTVLLTPLLVEEFGISMMGVLLVFVFILGVSFYFLGSRSHFAPIFQQ